MPAAPKPVASAATSCHKEAAAPGGTLKFSGGNIIIEPKVTTPPTPGPVIITANGGDAGVYQAKSGDGGNGGGSGGNAGTVDPAGGGGLGGTIMIKATTSIQITTATITLNGGDRLSLVQVGGNGGDAGSSKLEGDGGAGGQILASLAAGGGGSFSASSMNSSFIGSGIIETNGGSSYDASLLSGDGGNAYQIGIGGAGGDIGSGPGAGGGGMISVSTQGVLTFPTFESEGGSVNGTFNALSGNGGNGGSTFRQGGVGGTIMGSGSAGIGGMVDLTTSSLMPTSGNITVTTITVTGGNVANFNATSGNGGNASIMPESNSTGGNGGAIHDAGSAGGGGSIEITTKGMVTGMLTNTDVWDASGGSVGDYDATSGNGGTGSPTAFNQALLSEVEPAVPVDLGQ